MTGLFLSLDGIDGTGKSTQCRLLAAWLREQGHEVIEAIDPGGTPLGQEVRQILLTGKHDLAPACEALLFMASRAQLVATVIRPALQRGAIVLSDRYVLANIAYQGYGGGLDVGQLWAVAELSTGGVMPARTMVLDLPVELAQARRGRTADRIETREHMFHQRVRDGFLTEARRDPARIRVLDATADIDSLQAALRAVITELLP
jgi:dTMP kinase